MTIRNRLQLTGLVPILLLFLLSSYFVVISYLNFIKADNLNITLKNNTFIHHVLLNIGKERGLATLYLGSHNEAFHEAFTKQKAAVDQSIGYLNTKLITQSPYQIPLLSSIFQREKFFDASSASSFMKNLSALHDIRTQVEQKDTDFQTLMFKYYTNKCTTPLRDTLKYAQNFALNSDIGALLLSLQHLARAEEYTGLERGFVSYFLLQKIPMSPQEIQVWHTLRRKAQIMDTSYINDIALQETHTQTKQLQEIYTSIEKNIHDGKYNQETIHWFTQQSHKITLLSKMYTHVVTRLWQKSNFYLQKNLLLLAISLLLWLLSFILAYLHYKTTREMRENTKTIASQKVPSKIKQSNTNILPNTSPEKAEDSLLLAHASHDIRTPLHGMMGFIKLLESTPLDKEQKHFLSTIKSAASNLLELVNSHLHGVELQKEPLTLKLSSFKTQTLFEDAIEIFTMMAAEKNITLYFYSDPKIPHTLESDTTKLMSILHNLISNAIEYTPNAGEVHVEITHKHQEENIHSLHFLIRDTGVGISKEAQKEILKPFTRLTHTKHTQHSGLGLNITHHFISLLGGELLIQSDTNKGSSFSFTLALKQLKEQPKEKYVASYHFAINASSKDTHKEENTHRYLSYYHSKISYFHSLSELETYRKKYPKLHYWIDIDTATEEIIESIKNIIPSQCTIVSSIQHRSKIQNLGIDTNRVVYKPLTLTKIHYILQSKSVLETAQDKHAPLPNFTQFHAHALIVEDNTINLKLMQRMLAMHGISSDTAHEGLEGVKKSKNMHYDIIFMDIHMPTIDGIEATQFIRQYEEEKAHNNIPIIALTANTIEKDKTYFIENGFNEYIAKPIDTTELLRILHLFLHKEHKSSATQNTQIKEAKEETEAQEKLVVPTLIEDSPTLSTESISASQSQTVQKDEEEKQEHKPQKVDAFEENEIAQKKEQEQVKQILIAKRFLLEEKILVKMIDGLNYPYHVLDKTTPLKEALESYRYDIVFTDSHFMDDSIEAYHDLIHIITTQKSKEEIRQIILTQRG